MSRGKRSLKGFCGADPEAGQRVCHQALEQSNALPGGVDVETELYHQVGKGKLTLVRSGVFKPFGRGVEREEG